MGKTVNLFTPILTPLLSNRSSCQAIAGFAALHLGLVSLNLPSWPCPIRHGLGIPCPSCGMTRAIQAFMIGQWQEAMAIHAFAPLAVIAIALVGYLSVAPSKHRYGVVQRCKQIEQKTALGAVFVALFMMYWLIRLLFFRQALYQLVL